MRYDLVNAQREIRGLMRPTALKLRDGLAVRSRSGCRETFSLDFDSRRRLNCLVG